jgi:hypothetical protein
VTAPPIPAVAVPLAYGVQKKRIPPMITSFSLAEFPFQASALV